MTQYQSKTLKMMYNDHLEYIDCPKKALYEECIEIALERFEIPLKFKEFIQISNEGSEVFDKSTFEYYNLLFPSPAIIFYINIDSYEVDNKYSQEEREPFAKLINNTRNKRKCWDENYGVPVTRQNCFIGSLPEAEPASKKHKSSLSETMSDIGAVRRTISRRSIRI